MDQRPQLERRPSELTPRLGLNFHRTHWPTAPALKAHEAAGFSWVQTHTPPRAVLSERELCGRYARALRTALDTTGLRLLLHGPDELLVGSPEHDRAFEGLLGFARDAGAEIIVYHGMNIPRDAGREQPRPGERLLAEERALRGFAARAERDGLTIAVENLAPVYPSPPVARRVCHDPLAVRNMVRRIDSPAVGMLLDVGHANITCSLDGTSLREILGEVAQDVVLFHVHDNLGRRRHDVGAPGVDPVRLDLHLPPGSGSLPWPEVGPLLCGHHAPLMLEIEPSHRPDLVALAEITTTMLLRRRQLATA